MFPLVARWHGSIVLSFTPRRSSCRHPTPRCTQRSRSEGLGSGCTRVFLFSRPVVRRVAAAAFAARKHPGHGRIRCIGAWWGEASPPRRREGVVAAPRCASPFRWFACQREKGDLRLSDARLLSGDVASRGPCCDDAELRLRVWSREQSGLLTQTHAGWGAQALRQGGTRPPPPTLAG